MTFLVQHVFLLVLISNASCAFGFCTETHSGIAANHDEELFDGKSLDGWKGDPKFWRVENGVIVGETSKDNPTRFNTFLIYDKKQYGDFELKLKFRVDEGNSGIQFRSEAFGKDKFRVRGYQADIDGKMTYMGIAYEEGGRGILAQRASRVTIDSAGKRETTKLETEQKLIDSIKKNAWNEYTVIARGSRIIQKINGITTVDLTDNQSEKARRKGIIALQLHTGPPMKIEFKDIKISEHEHK